MGKLWIVFRFEFFRQVLRRGYGLITFGVPIAGIALFFLLRALSGGTVDVGATGGGSSDLPPGINIPGASSVSEDSPLAQARPMGFVDYSGLLGTVPTLIRYQTPDEALAALQRGEISAYYVIAADYLQTGKVEVFYERFNLGSISDAPLQQALLSALLKRTDLSPQMLSLLQARTMDIVPNAVGEAASQATENTNLILAYLFAMLLLFTVFTTSGYLMQSLMEEKENRAVEVLLSSLRPRDLLFGKFLAMSALGLLQMVLWLGTAIFLLGQAVSLSADLIGLSITTEQMIVLVAYFVLGYLFFGSLYAIIGALMTNMREGAQLSAVIVLPAMIPFYVAVNFVNTPNAPLPVILSMIPITSPLAMTLRAAVTIVPWTEVLLSLVLLSGTTLACVWLAARLFRVNTLLSGRAPKLRDVLRLVRERA